MTPSFAPTSTRVLESSDQNATLFNDVGLEDGGCPLGTIPIKRYTDEDLAQIKEFTKDYASRIKANKIQPQSGSHFAIVQTNSDPSLVKYYGVKGTFNVYRLSTGPSQYSLGEIIIQNGEDRIQVGWMDAKTGNWWLEFEGRQIGFWPRQIFSTLGSGATYIAVGGEAYGPVDQPLPPMGNGYYPVEDPKQSAFCYDLRVLNSDQQWINPEDTETFVNDDHYGVYDVQKQGKAERLVYYGGTTLWA